MDNRSNILSCALRLFASRGYDTVGIQEIVDTAGITKPTLYHYFGSKQGLLEALLKDYFDRLYTRVEQAAAYTGDLPFTLEKVVAAYFLFAKEQPAFYRMQLAMWFAPPQSDALKAVSQFNQKLHQLIEAMFIQAARDHGNMKGRHKAYAATLLGTINTYVALWLNGHVKLDDELVYKATHQFMHGIFS